MAELVTASGEPIRKKAKKHVIAGSRMVAIWECDGHNKNHDSSKWGYFAMPLMESDGKVKIYCRKTIEFLEEEIGKVDQAALEAAEKAQETTDAGPETVKPEVVADQEGLRENSSLPVYQGPLKEDPLILRPVRVADDPEPVVNRPPDSIEPGRNELVV